MTMKWFPVCVLLLTCSFLASAQSSEDFQDNLVDRGVRYETGRAAAWFPKDALSDARMRGVTDSLHLTIRMLENLMGAPYSWQVFQQRVITYYFLADTTGVYTSREDDIYVSLESLNNKDVAILQETIKALLRSKKGNWREATADEAGTLMPHWLFEGLTELMVQKVVHENTLNHLYEAADKYPRIDQLCRTSLGTSSGEQALQRVGTLGTFTALSQSKDAQLSASFNACSCSFVKFIADRYGLFVLLNAISLYQHEHIAIEGRTELTVDALKISWLEFLQSTK
jgi:hypothetical protein